MLDFSNPFELSAYIISMVGYSLFVIAAAMKRKNQILFLQSTANVLCAVSEGLIGAWSGFVQDLVNLIRNIFVMKKWQNLVISIIFIVLGTGLGVMVFILDFSKGGWWGLLPVFATLEYSIIILIPKVKIPVIKASIALSSTCWAVYGISIHLYTTTFFNSITICLSVASIILYFWRQKHPAKSVEKTPEINQENADE